MRQLIDQQRIGEILREIESNAQWMIDEFWQENEERRGTTDAGVLGVRIRREASSKWFRIVWYHNRFVRTGDGAGKKRVLSTEIPKGSGYRYHPNKFKKGKPWEEVLAIEMEGIFSQMRRAQDILKDIERQRVKWDAALPGAMGKIDPAVFDSLPQAKEGVDKKRKGGK